ncbi:class I SAM-dependent methyltransferase [Nocardia sp. CDC159]|uniref:Class I SAM-dependent methyltransferase n=1 Tax=Nocardia pulmonis TaxID=2951408 RepID=A0A9X2IXB7_9NOCA|nr:MULTISPECIES: class I SAM-dependent methyltransferase [Nocardia]MCM6775193.1 class I SAM-dependent methyltransferase [Nocardia pulmonis]MCM6789663.1 class I SAM-dependent methyltransferase [Nocardia sp. CDC159]
MTNTKHDHHHERPATSAREFWDGLYGERERIWSGNPNAWLVAIAGELTPGAALDLGCGEGGDAVWLAEHGWTVTAVDITEIALDRLRALAAERGVGERIRTERRDLVAEFPTGAFDLVSAQFLQSPVEFPRARVLRRAAEALAPGGLLLIVDHGAMPPWSRHPENHVDFPSPREVYEELTLDETVWGAELLEQRERSATGPDGESAVLIDNIIAIRRHG